MESIEYYKNLIWRQSAVSLDYHTYFPVVQSSRIELFELIEPILLSSGMSFSGECMELAWNHQEARYVLTYQERRFDTPRDAISATDNWAGIMLEYDAPFGDRSIFFWRSEKGDGEVFGFEDTSGHFVTLTANEERWWGFEEFIMDLAAAMDSPYALNLSDPRYLTMSVSEVCNILDLLPDDPVKARPPLIVLRPQITMSPRARTMLAKYYCMRDTTEYIVYQEKEYGMCE